MLQARGFLTEVHKGWLCGKDTINRYLRVGPDGYHASAEVLPLGTRSAIPETAGTVDTVEVLS
eukprot:9359544-Heterocapsa_arctica.AAC.1